jgi:hypothetical protein
MNELMNRMIFRMFAITCLVSIVTLLISCKSNPEKGDPPPSKTPEYHYIRDYKYAQNRVFDLGFDYEFSKGDVITEIKLFEGSEDPYEDTMAVYSILAVDPTVLDCPAFLNLGVPVKEISYDRFSCFNDTANNQHYVILDSSSALTSLGAWFIVQRDSVNSQSGQHIIDTIGNLEYNTDTVLLKMIRPDYGFIASHPCWNLMWRNVYSIPKGISLEDLDIRVFKGAIGTETTSVAMEFQDTTQAEDSRYIRILGLDQYSGFTKRPDNIVDDRIQIFRSDMGLLMFPNRFPFNSDTTFTDVDNNQTDTLRVKAPFIYDYMSTTQQTNGSKYFIRYTTYK